MRFVLFYHSLISDWNHGNAHFLRGIATELLARGHHVDIYEPQDAWSVCNLRAHHGDGPIIRFRAAYPQLSSICYDPSTLDLDCALDAADVVIVHEWNDPALVARIGEHRRHHSYRLLFHDTHHRSISNEQSITASDLSHYDGVLAFGEVIQQCYLKRGWSKRAWTWHEAADVRVFRPRSIHQYEGDVVWIGNWGDDERSAELYRFLFEPIRDLGLKAHIYGVRYPQQVLADLTAMHIDYRGWLPNYRVPEVFARFRVTIHVPRRFYAEALPGIPTIRPFEALACGIPLICTPWQDAEGLFTPGKDFLVARNAEEMRAHLHALLREPALARELSAHGLRTIRSRHTCAHRVDELLAICGELGLQVEGQDRTKLAVAA